MMHKAWCSIEEAPSFFQCYPSNFKVTREEISPILTRIEHFWIVSPVWIHRWIEMINKGWHSIEDVPYCFLKSFIKFQGHTGWKVDNFNPIWDYWASSSYQIPQMCLVEIKEMFGIKFCWNLFTMKQLTISLDPSNDLALVVAIPIRRGT